MELPVVATRDERGGRIRGLPLYARVERIGETAVDPVLAAHDGTANPLAGIVVLGVEPLATTKRARSRRDLHAPLALRPEPTLLSLGLLPLCRHGGDVRLRLSRSLAVVARAHAPASRFEHEATGYESIEQRAVVQDEDSDAVIGLELVEHA
jgi:hypothetical protein